MLSKTKILDIFGQEDPSPLTTSLRLSDDHGVGLVLEKLPEFVMLGGEGPCLGIEVVMLREFPLHFV